MKQVFLVQLYLKRALKPHSLPGSIAAEIRDWASRTLFMASSISLFDASAFSPGLKFNPAARFNLQMASII